MRRLFAVALAILWLVPLAAAYAATLFVTVTGARPAGQVRGMVFKDAASFDKRNDSVASFALTPRAGRVVAEIAGLAPGIYAVAVFQDTNGNRQLDTGMLGVPTEPYGFSNDARGMMGPPGFSDAAFAVGTANADVAIRLH